MRIWGIIFMFIVACGGGAGSDWQPAPSMPNLFAAVDVWTFSPTDVWVVDVSASSMNDVWAVGDDAIIAHHDGSAWRRAVAGSSFKSSIWGSGPDDVYALSTFDLVHYDGPTWTEIDLDAGAGDGQVWGTSASDAWVMTDSSELSHFDGARWETIDADSSYNRPFRFTFQAT